MPRIPEVTTTTDAKPKSKLYYGWIIAAVVALTSFANTPQTFPVIGVFMKPISEDFGWSRTIFTGAVTIGTLLGGLIALGVGPMLDRYGPRWIMVAGGTVMGVSMIGMGFLHNIWQYYFLQAVGRMVGIGVLGLAGNVIVPKWFVAKRGKAMALSSLGGRAGNAVMPLMAQAMVNIGGWRIAIALTGVVTLLLSAVPSILLRRKPEDLGLLPDGVQVRKVAIGDEKGQLGAGTKSSTDEVSFTVKEALREPSFYLLVTAFSFMFLFTAGLNLHMIPYFTDQGISNSTGVAVVAVWSASAGLGGLVMGALSDRISTRILVSLGFGLVSTSFVLLLFTHSAHAALLWGFYQGLMGGGLFVLQQIIFANYYGRASLGAINGTVWPVQMLTNSVGPIFASLSYDILGNYTLVFATFAALAAIAGICALLARPPICKGPQGAVVRVGTPRKR